MAAAVLSALAAAAAAPGKRLLEFGPGERRWFAEEEVQRLVGVPGQLVKFIDVTDRPNATRAKGLRSGAIPQKPSHQDYVRACLQQFSVSGEQATIEHLASYQTRYYTQQTAADAVRWLAGEYRAAAGGRPDVVVQEFEHSWVQPSLVVTIEGTGRGAPAAETVILGGHIDSTVLLSTVIPTSRAPGADDDASGSAGVLEVFRTLMANGFRPSRTVEFHAYAAEEVGLRGSGEIADLYATQGRQVVAMLQLDMTGYVRNGAPEVGVITDYTDPGVNAFMRQLIDEYLTIPWVNSDCGYGCSDHASFTQAGFPAAFAFETRFGNHNPNIHTANDDMSGVNMTHAAEFGKLGIAFATEFACDPNTEGCT